MRAGFDVMLKQMIQIPEKVNQIIEKLENAGFEAYAVGGCVRDSLLGRAPNDWDITTSASPARTKALFGHTVDTGIAHGTVTVLLGGEGFEVTTFRIDGAYEDARHPKEVTFTSNLREDLQRRDFTINAMACNERTGIVDAFGGMEDLEKRLIRCVGDPLERFSEDALRILRAVRFSAQLDFSIVEDTARAAGELAPNLAKISAERIAVELLKLITSDHPERIRDAWKMGITAVILPEFDLMMETEQSGPHHDDTVGEHTIHAMQAAPDDKIVRLTMLLHDVGKPETMSVDREVTLRESVITFKGHAAAGEKKAMKIMRRLKLDRDTMDKTARLIRYHSLYPELTLPGIRKAVYEIGEELFPRWLQVKRADVMAQTQQSRRVRLPMLDEMQRLYEEILEAGDCLSLKTMNLTGKDLIADGMAPGKVLGSVLEQLLTEVLEDPAKNEHDLLLARSRQLRQDLADASE